jgi:hypothetical protein
MNVPMPEVLSVALYTDPEEEHKESEGVTERVEVGLRWLMEALLALTRSLREEYSRF